MKIKSKKDYAIFFIILIFIGSLTFVYSLFPLAGIYSYNHDKIEFNIPEPERLTIQAVQVSSNDTLTIYVQNMPTSSMIINGAIVKDTTGKVFATDNTINETLTHNNLVKINVHYDNLPSGTYVVVLTTETGSSFYSPSFNMP